jgi:hypothetical protein
VHEDLVSMFPYLTLNEKEITVPDTDLSGILYREMCLVH